jgi:hypothetical protein
MSCLRSNLPLFVDEMPEGVPYRHWVLFRSPTLGSPYCSQTFFEVLRLRPAPQHLGH